MRVKLSELKVGDVVYGIGHRPFVDGYETVRYSVTSISNNGWIEFREATRPERYGFGKHIDAEAFLFVTREAALEGLKETKVRNLKLWIKSQQEEIAKNEQEIEALSALTLDQVDDK